MKNEAQIFKALGDETRLRILTLLLDGELCVCELMAALELPQSTVSRHLSYLKNSGWLDDRRAGVWMYYRLADSSALVNNLLPVFQAQFANHPEYRKARERLAAFRKTQKQEAC
jgi:ArsR family transcriptional regulator